MKRGTILSGIVGFMAVLGISLAMDMNGPLGPGGGGVNGDLGTNPSLTSCPPCRLDICSEGYLSNVRLEVDPTNVCPGTVVNASLLYDSSLPSARTIRSCPDYVSTCSSMGSYACRIVVPCENIIADNCSTSWVAKTPCSECMVIGTVSYVPETNDCGTISGPLAVSVTNTYWVKDAWVDLDIDSDHTHTLGNGGPDHDSYEDNIEALCSPDVPETNKFHKYVVVNDFNDTNSAPGYADVIPGYADGFDHNPAVTSDDSYERYNRKLWIG